jgi:hypothetical protein
MYRMLFVEGEVGGRVVQAVEEYVGMFQQHQALEVGGAASSCVQRQQTLKVDERRREHLFLDVPTY